MINLDSITNENNKEHNEKWPYIRPQTNRPSLQNCDNRWFWIRKKNALLNLIKEQDNIDKIYLYAKDLSEPNYEFLIKKCKNAGIKYLNDSETFTECSNTMDDVYKNIDNYNPNRQIKILIVFDDMIADIMSNNKFQTIIKDLFIRSRKLNILLVFITQSYFSVPKDVKLNSTHYLITKINKEIELHNIAFNHSADIDYNDFMKIYRKYTKEPYYFLTIDTT